MPWRCAELCLGGTPTPKTKLTHRPSQLKTLQHNSFPMFLFCSDSCHHVWNFLRINPCRGGGRWGQSGPWTPALLCKLLPSNHHPADSRPLTNICMRFEDQQKMFFPVGWPSSPPPVKRRCYEFQVVGTSVWRTGHPLPGGVGEKKSPVLDPLLSKPSPTRVQLEKTKTLCRDVHRRQKGEKSNHIEEIFCTLCWFWGSVGKRRKPGQGRAPPPPPAGKHR